MSGRILAIGDIHGCDVALETLLSKLQPGDGDVLVVLGDVVDNGPNTRRAIKLLLDARTNCRLILILGNHDEMFLRALKDPDSIEEWLNLGGRETLNSYGGSFESIPDSHVDFLSGGLPHWETDCNIFIHAILEPDVPLEEQPAWALRYTRLSGYERPHPSGRRIICGHSSQRAGLPLVLDGWVCLDTRVYDNLWLTILDVDSDEIFQASQAGEFRQMTLSEAATAAAR